MFYVVEQFFSIQGEGRYAGKPSYFIRTGGCNLQCPGFLATYSIDGSIKHGCDTYFAVDSSYAKLWDKIDNLDNFINKLDDEFKKIGYLPDVVITGGEPLMYYQDNIFYGVIEWLVNKGINITFETNGTVEVDFNHFPSYKEAIFSLSVKLSNSGEPYEKRVNVKALNKISQNSKESFLKFTIDKSIVETTALKEINDISSIVPHTNIYCMPVGESRDTIWSNDKSVFEFCMKHNFIYSDRLHIRVFDTTKGV